ncbi:MAG: mechanosensitive ion channel family protein [Betaproteobacteria bacterium]
MAGQAARAVVRWLSAIVALVLVAHAAAAATAAAGGTEAPMPQSAPPLAADGLRASAPSEQRQPEATFRLLNREIITFRASLAGASPQARAERARARFRELPESAIDLPLRAVPFSLGGVDGVQLLMGDHLLFGVLAADADVENKQSLDALSKQTLARLEEARAAWHQTRDTPLLLRGLAQSAVATLVLGLLIWVVFLGSRKAVRWIEKVRDRLAVGSARVDWRELLARLTVGTMQLVQWFVLLALGYVWLRTVLASFVATQPLATQLGSWFWGKVQWVADGVLHSLPGIVTLIIVLVLTRAVVDVFGYFFNAVQRGRLQLPFLHPETTSATRRIVTLIVWGLGIAIAYPYLPGASSEAFKGLSVLLGVMVTLGSAGLVTQAMSGLVLIYARALRKGDFVEVNGVQGVVTEVAALATKIINMRNEEITIPNSVLIASPIHNYSKLAGTQGTLLTTKVTIGYDTSWRQVHAMLEEAARRTANVRREPVPYVYQRALSDFYVEYELFVSIDKPLERIPIQSALHASIQDVFNEYGVQIMSPHFLGQPEQAVVVPKGDWFKAPARATPGAAAATGPSA